MTAVNNGHEESAFWDAEAEHSLDESPSWSAPEEELALRPEAVTLERWLDLNA